MSSVQEVHCDRLRFRPGDRVLVRCLRPISRDQREKLTRAVQRWAGQRVEVFVYSATDLEVLVEQRTG